MRFITFGRWERNNTKNTERSSLPAHCLIIENTAPCWLSFGVKSFITLLNFSEALDWVLASPILVCCVLICFNQHLTRIVAAFFVGKAHRNLFAAAVHKDPIILENNPGRASKGSRGGGRTKDGWRKWRDLHWLVVRETFHRAGGTQPSKVLSFLRTVNRSLLGNVRSPAGKRKNVKSSECVNGKNETYTRPEEGKLRALALAFLNLHEKKNKR